MARTMFVADVGNSSIHIGEFNSSGETAACMDVPRPTRTERISAHLPDWNQLSDWPCRKDAIWHIGSVNEPAKKLLIDWLGDAKDVQVQEIAHAHLKLPTAVRQISRLGIDRLAGGLAANQLRHAERPAIVIDAGTAITIDVVSAAGVFLGGMIAPGLQLGREALADHTYQLPEVELHTQMPALIGNDTSSAIQAGVFWMIVAGIEGILGRLQRELAGPCDVFATGGSILDALNLVSHDISHEPHLVLSGLAMATP